MYDRRYESREDLRRRQQAIFRRRRLVAGSTACLVLALVIYGGVAVLSGGPPAKTPPSAPGSTSTTLAHHTKGTVPAVSSGFGVGERTELLVDNSPTLSTYNYLTGTSTKGRRFTTEVYYPTAPTRHGVGPALTKGPYPVVVFAHGYQLRPEDYVALFDRWVKAGFVVVAPAFPDTVYPQTEPPARAGFPHGSPESAIYDQPVDVAFIVSSVESQAREASSFLHGLADPGKVVLAGHSDGADTVAALVYDKTYADPTLKVAAVAVLSGAEFALASQVYGQPTPAVPLLLVQSATDTCNAPESAALLYDSIGAPKNFLELDNASHLGAYNGTDAAAFSVVAASTIAFFDSVLGRSGPATGSSLTSVGTVAKVSSLTSAQNAPINAALSGSPVCPTG